MQSRLRSQFYLETLRELGLELDWVASDVGRCCDRTTCLSGLVFGFEYSKQDGHGDGGVNDNLSSYEVLWLFTIM